jgi:hypothetical protein
MHRDKRFQTAFDQITNPLLGEWVRQLLLNVLQTATLTNCSRLASVKQDSSGPTISVSPALQE